MASDSFSFSFKVVYLKLNGAFWANYKILKKENIMEK